jgi:hypothetical protein
VYLDFADDDAGFGGYLRLEGQSVWAAVVGFGAHPLVALRDDELPRHRGLDVRTDGLWASLTCETPGEHWSAGMEAFAVGYDDPVAALDDERGDIVALGFDLEWERSGDLWLVHGDVLVGDGRIALDTRGSVGEHLVTGRVGGRPFASDDLIPIVTPDGLLAGGVGGGEDLRVQLEPRWHAPIKSGGGIARALCALTASDGDAGVAWVSARAAVT